MRPPGPASSSHLSHRWPCLHAPPCRVAANNDAPNGPADITLEATLPADWEGWEGAAPCKSSDGGCSSTGPRPAAAAEGEPRAGRPRAKRAGTADSAPPEREGREEEGSWSKRYAASQPATSAGLGSAGCASSGGTTRSSGTQGASGQPSPPCAPDGAALLAAESRPVRLGGPPAAVPGGLAGMRPSALPADCAGVASQPGASLAGAYAGSVAQRMGGGSILMAVPGVRRNAAWT